VNSNSVRQKRDTKKGQSQLLIVHGRNRNGRGRGTRRDSEPKSGTWRTKRLADHSFHSRDCIIIKRNNISGQYSACQGARPHPTNVGRRGLTSSWASLLLLLIQLSTAFFSHTESQGHTGDSQGIPKGYLTNVPVPSFPFPSTPL
jgi:hypothetical protein